MLPPRTRALLPRLNARTARRARLAAEHLAPLAGAGPPRAALGALRSALASARGSLRASFLSSPELRQWVHQAEEALAFVAAKGTDRALFERVATGPDLRHLLPAGRLDRAFRGRLRRLGRERLARVIRRLPPIVAGLIGPAERFGPFPLDLDPDGEEARLRGEVHLRFPVPASLRCRPGARIELIAGGIRIVQRGSGARWVPRPTLTGSDIVIARRVRWTRQRLRPGPAVPGLADRLEQALLLVQEAWPEAHREILAHTREIVPLLEAGVVSYSLPERPGTSYINVQGKSRLELADDLLHETAHHRLHRLEEWTPLHHFDPEAVYYSPWRRSLRPLHGILHAAYTFAFRAELLQRLLSSTAGRRLPRAWMRREVEWEIASLAASLVSLADAERRGLLTPAGSGVRRALASQVRRLARGSVSR